MLISNELNLFNLKKITKYNFGQINNPLRIYFLRTGEFVQDSSIH